MGKREGDWSKYNYEGVLFLITTYKNGIEINRFVGIKNKEYLIQQINKI